jgi:uncharacterized damage-inducible protein DinB
MSRTVDPILAELQHEAAATRRLLERVPADKLEWRPHEKSMTLGELALHVASIPGTISGLLEADEFEVGSANFSPSVPGSAEELAGALDGAVAAARDRLGGWDDARAASTWSIVREGNVILSDSRIAIARMMLLNHWYHHRGQLTVYLRLLGVPLPVVYGRSADENPFAA